MKPSGAQYEYIGTQLLSDVSPTYTQIKQNPNQRKTEWNLTETQYVPKKN